MQTRFHTKKQSTSQRSRTCIKKRATNRALFRNHKRELFPWKSTLHIKA